MLHPDVREDLRGTYAGLASEPAIEYLHHLGVTAVELLPVHHISDESFLAEKGLTNYWGYSTIGYLSPHSEYAATGRRGEQVREFKGMVKALHRAGIEVILDVVYNHTAEGNHLGPMLSFKGVDNLAYYRRHARRPPALHGLHGHRQLAQPGPSECPAPDHGLAPLLGDRVPRRRLPLRPRLRARARVLRRRPPVGVLRRHPSGPGAVPGQADRRAVGRRPRRLPGRQLPGLVVGVERRLPRHDARLLARVRRQRRVRRAAVRVGRPVRGRRPRPVRVDQLHHGPRRLHAARPRLLRPQAQRGQPRGQPGRHRRQPLLEPRGRGRDRRSGDHRAPLPPAAQLPGHAVPLTGHADVARRRRDRADPARQQQRLVPGQRDLLVRLEREPREDQAPRIHAPPDPAAQGAQGVPAQRLPARPGAHGLGASGRVVVPRRREQDDPPRLAGRRARARDVPQRPRDPDARPAGAGRRGRLVRPAVQRRARGPRVHAPSPAVRRAVAARALDRRSVGRGRAACATAPAPRSR